MSRESSLRNLQIITVLDSISYGLIYSFISTYILKLGGSHITTGLYSIADFIGQLLAPDVVNTFTHLHGKRYTLFFILNTAMVTHLMLVLTNNIWFTILVRVLFSITNQSQNLCLELLLNKAKSEREKQKLRTNYSILSGSGYIIGPMLCGYMFDRGFGYVGLLAAVLTFINSYLLMGVTKDEKDANPEHSECSVLEKAAQNVQTTVQDFGESDYQKHWDIIVVKYLFASSVMIFFSKFSQIIKFRFEATNVIIGYTIAYINLLVFVATYYTALLKSKSESFPIVFLCEIMFFLLTVLIFLACFAPYYELYMVILAPIIFLRTFLTSMWKDIFSERMNEKLTRLNNSVSVVAGLTVPLLFGVTCNRIAHNAVIFFSCVPLLTCWVITRWYSRFIEVDKNKND